MPSAVWDTTLLPQMGLYLGVKEKEMNPFKKLTFEEFQLIRTANVFPEQPLLSAEEWFAIKEFYISKAPKVSLPQKDKPTITIEDFPFDAQSFRYDPQGGPLVTLTQWDSVRQGFWLSQGQFQLSLINNQGNIVDSLRIKNPIAGLRNDAENNLWLTAMGSLHPQDRPLGQVIKWDNERNITPLLQGLHRPIFSAFDDLDQDGKEDMVVCNFGYHLGQFSVYHQEENGKYTEKILAKIPGALVCEIKDLNGDGLQDIIVLMGQGNEGIFIYWNEGERSYRQENLLRFNPSFGSSYFQLLDYDKDGDLDILYTNGDNADYSYCLKPYHGVRIFLNDGKNQFEEAYFFPMYGATKALARDFDGDGDYDIAAIAFFADFENTPAESFLYLENKNASTFSFQPRKTNVASQSRWITMDAGDMDQDGDLDIALGAFSFAPTPVPDSLLAQWHERGPHLMLLENNLRNKD